MRDLSSCAWSVIFHGDLPISTNLIIHLAQNDRKVFTDCKKTNQVFHTCSIHATRTLISHGQGTCGLTSIQYVFMIYLSDRVRLIRLSIHRYKQSVRYLQTMFKSYVQHNYFENQLNIPALIYKQTRQFVCTFHVGNIILQRIEVNT